jgi:hypothetical protein
LSTRRKELPQFKKRQYNSRKRKDWVFSSLTGRMTFLVELSGMLNTLDAFVHRFSDAVKSWFSK